MNTGKTSLAVAALASGTVIDHIPAANLFKAVRILNIEKTMEGGAAVTIGANLPSSKLGLKGIIKVAGTFYPQGALDRLALVAPQAKVNVIRDYEVVEKRPVSLPDTVVGLVRCPNPKCITNHEPMPTRFDVTDRSGHHTMLRCSYCDQDLRAADAEII